MSGLKTLVTGKSGGDKYLRRFTPAGFSSAGLSGSFNKATNTYNLTRSSALNLGLINLQARLGDRAKDFRGLRGSEMFDNLINSRVQAIRDAGSRTVGNLREELGRRRVAGSSFAEREISATEAMFAREEERAAAEGRITQLGFEAQLIDQQHQASVQAAQVAVNQLNLESGLAAQLAQGASNQMLNIAGMRADLRSAAESAQIDFFTTLATMGMGANYGV